MSEGGRFPWKLQKIFSVPVGRYERLRESLPKPPEGMAWYQNKETREWKLVPEEELPRLVENNPNQKDVQQQEVTVDFTATDATTKNEKTSPFENPFQVGKQEQEKQEEQDKEEENLKVDLQASETTQTTQPASNVHADADAQKEEATRTRSESPVIFNTNTNTNVSTPKAKNTSTTKATTNTTPTTHFENLPTDFVVEQEDESKQPEHNNNNNEDDWEFLSESGRNSQRTLNSGTIGDGMAFVTRSGSIKSFSNNSCYSSSYNNHNNKLQRSPSSSTIDSHDFYLGPAGKGILGVDYVEHGELQVM